MSDGREALYITRSSDGALVRRPMSPHLQVYKLPLAGKLSISNRMASVALSFGTLLMVVWLVAAASSPYAFALVQWFIGSPLGLLLVFGWSVALCYHFFAGLRHLFWDAGVGYSIPAIHRGNWVTIALTLLSVAAIWLSVFVLWPTHVAPNAPGPQAEAPAPNPAPAQ